jgi:hypothetical protein
MGEAMSSEEQSGFVRALAEGEARRRRRESRRTPQLWVPGSVELDTEIPAEPPTEFSTDVYQGRRSCQVGLRLRPRHFERLARAAEIYGVRPTTLARMMVLRGVNAILDAELERDRKMLRDE